MELIIGLLLIGLVCAVAVVWIDLAAASSRRPTSKEPPHHG
jgi:energy-converting hydrogenase Eha subunit C